MTFAIKEEWDRECHQDFFSSIFCLKAIWNHSLTSKTRLHIVWASYYIYLVVELTMNMAEYGSRRSKQHKNVNFEPIIRGLKSDIFEV